MPFWLGFPRTEEDLQERYDFLSSEKTHSVAVLLAAGITELAMLVYPPTRPVALLPGVSLGTWVALHEAGHWAWDSLGLGAPSGSSPTRTTTASKRPSEFRKAVKAKSAHGFRKTKGVSARGKCPKGHYWSYKEKKCVKSRWSQSSKKIRRSQ